MRWHGRKRLVMEDKPLTHHNRQTDRWFRAKTAEWLVPLLETGLPISTELVCCITWCLGDMTPVHADLRRFVSPKKGRARQALLHFDGDEIDWSEDLDDLARHYPQLAPVMLDSMLRECRKRGEEEPSTDIRQADMLLRDLFGLDEQSRELCQFVFAMQHFRGVESLFEDDLAVQSYAGQPLLALALGVGLSDLRSRMREMVKSGILEADNLLRLNSELVELWGGMTPAQAEAHFCKPVRGDTLPLSEFSVPQESVEHVCSLLRNRSSLPVHILLYGAPGTGKSTFARSVMKTLRLRSWSVPPDERDSGRRRSALRACLNLASQNKRAVVLVDEAERMLESDSYGLASLFGLRDVQDKAWLNELLEEPGRRMIWITNATTQIDPSVLRRFTYSISFEELGRRERRAIWERVLRRHKAENRLDSATLENLANRFAVPPAVVEMTTQQSLAVSKGNPSCFVPALERALTAYETLRHHGAFRPKRDKLSGYTLEGVNADTDVSGLLDRLRQADTVIRSGKSLEGACTLLFYGPPGTGKTALAQHIAYELDRECHVLRASDILDKYVGETEGKIAAAFRKAEREQAVLVFDEADSFIFSRETAQQSWETSMVNEFLTAIEQFRGILICTTNRKEGMDKAAMRRFTFKVGFKPLTPDQAVALFKKTLLPLTQDELDDTDLAPVRHIPGLTPGDFRSVRAAYAFCEPWIPVEELFSALKKETEGRTTGKKMGF